MSRIVRPAALAAIVALALASCGSPKPTGLPAGPTPEPVKNTLVKATAASSFDPKELTVPVGETVTWEFEGPLHNVVFSTLKVNSHPECAGAAPDSCAPVGSEFEYKFEAEGDFLYYCIIHGTPAGGGMSGTIIVTAAAAE